MKEKWDICEWITRYIEKNLDDWEKYDSEMHEQAEKIEIKEKAGVENTTTTVWKKTENIKNENKQEENQLENNENPKKSTTK